MAALRHRLLVRVPRLVEREPGHMDDQALTPGDDTVWTVGGYYEPLSRRWMGQVSAGPAPASWSGVTHQMVMLDAGMGVRTTTAATGQWAATAAGLMLPGRGFWFDWYAYEGSALTAIEWGGRIPADDGQVQHHWRLAFTTLDTHQGLCTVEEHDGEEWQARASVVLIDGASRREQYRIWCQPLSDDEWLLRNYDNPALGAIITARHPHEYDTGAVVSAEDTAPRMGYAPWGPAGITVRGSGALWFQRYDLNYESVWAVGSRGERSFGYLCTQPYTHTMSAWLPDGRPQATDGTPGLSSAAEVTLEVLTDQSVESSEAVPEAQPAPWVPIEDGLPGYGWRVRVSSSDTTRTVVLDRLMLRWPRTLADDGATEIDLIGHPEVSVLGMVEDRSYRDQESTLTVQLHGPADLLDHITMPAQRWQWRLVSGTDDDPGVQPAEYVRFDGLRDTAPLARYTLVDGTWTADTTVTIRTRWRQAEAVMYRGQTIIDGLPRTEAYRALAALIPLDETEVVVPVPLPDDGPLPMAKRGQPPLWSAEVGVSLGSLIADLADVAGPRDRLLFRDWDGVAALVVDQPSGEPVARFYRTQAAADAAGVPAQCLRSYDKRQGMVIGWDDSEFFNEIVVVGTAPADVIYDLASGPEREVRRGAPIVCYFAAPESWQIAEIAGAVNRRYVGCRRAVVYDDPQLNTPLAVERRLRGLVEQFYRFRSGGQVSAGLVPDLYPGDVIVIDPGDEDGAADAVYEVRGMRTEVLSLHAADRGIVTLYELGEVPG